MNPARYWRCVTHVTCVFWFAWSGLAPANAQNHSAKAAPRTMYYVNCGSTAASSDGSLQSPIRTLAEANALLLRPGDNLLFKRGSTCNGALRPLGSGNEAAPIRIGAYGEGSLPRIEARSTDESALRLFNQSFWEISSLDLKGGTNYGFFAGGDAPSLPHIYLRDLRVHDVRGALKQKASGLVVIKPSGKGFTFQDVDLDGVLASNTTQWSGIYIAGASQVRIRNSMVHDVQGDGIVVFEARDATIARSVAWHTGMQHQLTIGTPNAIWTWHCIDCTVEDNEAFLTDSPGVDGGAFDIDFGNTRNTVRRNFGHDTVGYCVSILGAFGPTTDSVVADNLCLNNGMSPRLAQRQGAVLLMTWRGGSLKGVEVRGNRVDWQPPGETPAVQSGADLNAAGITLRENEIYSTGDSFVSSDLKYIGERNRYVVASGDPVDLSAAQKAFAALPENGSILAPAPPGTIRTGAFGLPTTNTRDWQLIAFAPASMLRGDRGDILRGTLVELKSAALQFVRAGLEVKLVSEGGAAELTTAQAAVPKLTVTELANDWLFAEDGITLKQESSNQDNHFSVKLISPRGEVVREWNTYPPPVELGLALRQNLGPPNFGHLKLENVRATD
jgi:Right handed beta helix region